MMLVSMSMECIDARVGAVVVVAVVVGLIGSTWWKMFDFYLLVGVPLHAHS